MNKNNDELVDSLSDLQLSSDRMSEITEITDDSFKNLQNACLLGMDIGGSLIKIAYSSSYDVKTSAFSEVFLSTSYYWQ